MEMLKLILIATIRESSEVFLKGFEIIKLTYWINVFFQIKIFVDGSYFNNQCQYAN